MKDTEKTLEDAVFQAVSATFEGLAFICIKRRSNEIPPDVDPAVWMWAKVNIEGSIKGEFTLVCLRKFLENMFVSLYGKSADAGDEQKLTEILKESVNTAAGQCMRLLVPRDMLFNLSVPTGGQGWPKLNADYFYRFNTQDEKPVLVIMNLPFLKF